MKAVYTTGQAAVICKVSQNHIVNCFDSGILVGFRIPHGARERRIPGVELLRFMKEHGIPLGDLEFEQLFRVLLVTDKQSLIDDSSWTQAEFRMEVARSSFECGLALADAKIECAIIDFKEVSIEVANWLAKKLRDSGVKIVIGIIADGQSEHVNREFFSETFRSPFDTALLAGRVKILIGRQRERVF